MATIARPLKEGNVRTYQEKVALGFPDILASEADADLDTIYTAWNGGVDSVNIKDGAVTQAKLAAGVTAIPSGPAGGDLGANYPNPTVLKAAGNFTAAGFSVGRIYAGEITQATAANYPTGYTQVGLPNVVADSGGIAVPGTWQLTLPAWASWCLLSSAGGLDASTGSGVLISIETFVSGSWFAAANGYLAPPANLWSFTRALAIPVANVTVRLTMNNFTGAARTMNAAWLAAISVGKT